MLKWLSNFLLLRAGMVAWLLSSSGCSVKDFAIREIASSLAEGSGSAFAQEADIEFAQQAIPFSLKLIESLLETQPDNADLLLAASAGFTRYAKGWVEQPADFAAEEDFFAAQHQRERAAAFYARAHGYAMAGLESGHPGFAEAFAHRPVAAVDRLEVADVDLIYWAAASLGSQVSLSRTNPELIARLPAVEALAQRAHALDPDWGDGALHELLMTLTAAGTGDPREIRRKVKEHYESAVALAAGAGASVHVGYAEAMAIQDQDRAAFEALLQRALMIDADAFADNRLAILIAQQRANWLLGRVDDLFLE